MKTLITLAGVAISLFAIVQQPPGFFATYEEAKSNAEANNQLLMIDFYTDWCAPCKRIEKEVYFADEFQEINASVSAVKINYETEEGKALGEQYDVSSFPTIVFIEEGKEVERITSYNSKERHLRDMKRILSGEHTVAIEAKYPNDVDYADLFHLTGYYGRRYYNLEKREVYHKALLNLDPDFGKDSTRILTNVLYQSQLIFGDDMHVSAASDFVLKYPNEVYQAELMFRLVSHLAANDMKAEGARLHADFESSYAGDAEGKKYIKQAKKLVK